MNGPVVLSKNACGHLSMVSGIACPECEPFARVWPVGVRCGGGMCVVCAKYGLGVGEGLPAGVLVRPGFGVDLSVHW